MDDPPPRASILHALASPRCRSCLFLVLVALAFAVLTLPHSASASIHRHADYTLYPCKQKGAPNPARQFARFKPKRPPRPHKRSASSSSSGGGGESSSRDADTDSRSSSGAAARRLLQRAFAPLSASPSRSRRFTAAASAASDSSTGGVDDSPMFDDPDAAIEPPAENGDPDADASTDPWSRLREDEARAALDEQLQWREIAPIENLPFATSTTLEENEARAFANVSGIELERRVNASRAAAAVSVTKLSLWHARSFPAESQDSPLQHGHLILLSNPADHFAFLPPRGGCAETANRGGLERVQENARRNRCRVATNAGFFDVVVPRGFERRPGEFVQQCFGALISRGGTFVQKQHTQLLSRQFKRNVHFGITSHAHFFVGYLTQQMWERHLKEGSKLPADIDDLTETLRQTEQESAQRPSVHRMEAAAPDSAQQTSAAPEPDQARVDPVTRRSYTVRSLGQAAAAAAAPSASPAASAAAAAANVTFIPLSAPAGWHFSTLLSGLLWLVRDGRDYVLESTLHDREDFAPETAWCQGAENCEEDESGFRWREHFIHLQSARTAIGHTATGELLLLQIDGKSHDATVFPDQQLRDGVNLHDMARLLIELGAINAINLDGGGSATTVVEGIVSNYPTDGIARPSTPVEHYAVVDRKVSSITCIYDGIDAADTDATAEGALPMQPVVINPPLNVTINATSVTIANSSTISINSTAVSISSTAAMSSSTAAATALSSTASSLNSTALRNATAVQTEDGLAVRPQPELDADSAATIADLQSQVFWYSVLLPLLLVVLLLLSLVLLYFLCVHRQLRKGFQRLGEDASNAAASSPRAMRSGSSSAADVGMDIDATAAGVASADPELGAVRNGASRPSRAASSRPLPPFVSPSHHSAFASSSLESRENLSLDGQRAAVDASAAGGAAQATSPTDRRLQAETAAQRKQTQSDRKKLNSVKYGGAAESVGGLLASSPSPPAVGSSNSGAAPAAAAAVARFEIGAEDDLFDDDDDS